VRPTWASRRPRRRLGRSERQRSTAWHPRHARTSSRRCTAATRMLPSSGWGARSDSRKGGPSRRGRHRQPRGARARDGYRDARPVKAGRLARRWCTRRICLHGKHLDRGCRRRRPLRAHTSCGCRDRPRADRSGITARATTVPATRRTTCGLSAPTIPMTTTEQARHMALVLPRGGRARPRTPLVQIGRTHLGRSGTCTIERDAGRARDTHRGPNRANRLD
jgi:hypothetical protein